MDNQYFLLNSIIVLTLRSVQFLINGLINEFGIGFATILVHELLN